MLHLVLASCTGGQARSTDPYLPELAGLLSPAEISDLPFCLSFDGSPAPAAQTAERSSAAAGSAFASGAGEPWNRLRSEAAIERRLLEAPTPEAQAAWGVVQLVNGRPTEALELLDRAGRGLPPDHRVLSDRAAANLLLYRQEGQVLALLEGLAHAERAALLAPHDRAAHCNRALALEELGLGSAAADSWRRARQGSTAVDATARRAQEHLRRLEQAAQGVSSGQDELEARLLAIAAEGDEEALRLAVDPTRQEARLLVKESLLFEWAQEAVHDSPMGRDRAVLRLDQARNLAKALQGATGDPLLGEAVETIDDALGREERMRLQDLRAGHKLFGEGLVRYRARDLERARRLMERAQARLDAAESPFAHWAAFYRAVCLYMEGDNETASKLFEDLATGPGSRAPSLRARALWLRGLLHMRQGEPGAAIHAYHESASIFEELGERGNAAYLAFLLAEARHALGSARSAWALRLQALRSLAELREPHRAHNVLLEASRAAWLAGYPEVSLHLHEELLRLARSAEEDLMPAEAEIERARLLTALGQTQAALQALTGAQAAAERIQSAGLRSRIHADVRLRRGQALVRAGKAHEAARELAGVQSAYAEIDYRVLLPELFHARSLAARGAGDGRAAQAFLDQGIRELETQRESQEAAAFRTEHLLQARGLYEELVDLTAARPGGAEAALVFSERYRAAQLPVSLPAPAPSSIKAVVPGVLSGLPAGTSALATFVTGDGLHLWWLGDGRLRHRFHQVEPQDLAHLVAEFRAGLQESDPGRASEAGARLAELLLEPFRSELDATAHLILVPDGPLRSLPVAALSDRAGDLQVEARVLSVLPSLWLLQRSLAPEAAAAPARPPRSLIAFADPRFDPGLFPELARLPEALAEAESIARLYPEAAIYAGSEATGENFLFALHHAEVVHFGGHAVVKAGPEATAILLLAPGAAGPASGIALTGVVDSAAILSAHRPASRLVVLAACSSLQEGPERGSGLAGLATPLLAGGVPAVLGTLWPVADSATGRLLLAFHTRFRQTGDAARALREAQLEILRAEGATAPGVWAAFQVAGIPHRQSGIDATPEEPSGPRPSTAQEVPNRSRRAATEPGAVRKGDSP